LKNAHLQRSPHPSSLQRTSKYASLLKISGAPANGISAGPTCIGHFLTSLKKCVFDGLFILDFAYISRKFASDPGLLSLKTKKFCARTLLLIVDWNIQNFMNIGQPKLSERKSEVPRLPR